MSIEDIKDDASVEDEKLESGEVVDSIEHDDDDESAEESTAKVDSELEGAESEEDREAIRVRRRAERKSRGQRNRERVEALERNLQAVIEQNRVLQGQVGSIQDAATGSQLAQVDQLVNQANTAAEHFKRIIAEAVAKNDGNTVAEATEYMIQARTRAKELSDFKTNATRAINAPKPLDTRVVSKSQEFMTKNKWYSGPQSADPDSKVLTALDNSLAAEGWDASTDAYWVELETRAKKYLSHRFTPTAAPRTPSRQPVPGGDGGSQAPRANTFQLSPDRVAAIKSAGMWDDPAARNKMIQQYRNYDKQSKG